MSSNTCNYTDYGVDTIKRQSRAAYGRSLYAKVCGRRLSIQPIGYSPALSLTYSAAAAAVAACGAIYTLSLTLPFI